MEDKTTLITLFVLIYNNENYLEDAIKSALNQTYQPLEIIVSDDKSTDKSSELIEKIVKDYKGPHSVVVNKNKKNRGICGHINHIVSIAKGDFLVVLAGDDIAEPDRVEKIYNHLLRKEVHFLCTDYYEIYNSGTEKKEVKKKNVNETDIILFLKEKFNYSGATEAFSKELFKTFGNLNEDNFIEDAALAFRGFLLNKVAYLNEFTIQYRIHGSNLSQGIFLKKDKGNLKKHFAKWYPAIDKLYNQHLTDLEIAYTKELVNEGKYLRLKNIINNKKIQNSLSYQLDLYWLSGLEGKNIIKLVIESVYYKLPLSFIGLRLFKKVKTLVNTKISNEAK